MRSVPLFLGAHAGLSEADGRALVNIIEDGARGAAGRLAAMTGACWQHRAALVADAAERLRGDAGPRYGAYFIMPGGAFLALFDPMTTTVVAAAYAPGSRVGRRAGRDLRTAAAEVANIVVDAIATSLVDVCGMACFLSAPRIAAGRGADLVTRARDDFGANDPRILAACVGLTSPLLRSHCSVVALFNSRFVDVIKPILACAQTHAWACCPVRLKS